MSGWDVAVTYLVQLGIPGALFTAIGYAVRAWVKRRALIESAPDRAIDTSMARSQQVVIMQDTLVDNLKDALDAQTRRAEAAEAALAAAAIRENELRNRITALERSLEDCRRRVDVASEQMSRLRDQVDSRDQ